MSSSSEATCDAATALPAKGGCSAWASGELVRWRWPATELAQASGEPSGPGSWGSVGWARSVAKVKLCATA